MLACGQICQPTEIREEIQLFDTSTRPARVATDSGDGFIKGVGNPQGSVSLVSELVAAELGTWFGLQIPPFAVVAECDIDIPMIGCSGVMGPPLFFSSAVDGMPRDTSDTFLKRLSNPDDVAKLIIFDTWIRNNDRYVEGAANSDNLLYVTVTKGKKYALVPIDHSHCFVDIDFDTDLPAPELVIDPNLYGFYPEFEGFVNSNSVAIAVEKLRELDEDFVAQCVNSIPIEWGMNDVSRSNLKEFICDRAKFVVETVSMKMVNDPQMPGLGGGM